MNLATSIWGLVLAITCAIVAWILIIVVTQFWNDDSRGCPVSQDRIFEAKSMVTLWKLQQDMYVPANIRTNYERVRETIVALEEACGR